MAALCVWARKNKPRNGKRIITIREIQAQATGAYRNDYSSHGCEDPAIMPFCDPACPIYDRVKHDTAASRPPIAGAVRPCDTSKTEQENDRCH